MIWQLVGSPKIKNLIHYTRKKSPNLRLRRTSEHFLVIIFAHDIPSKPSVIVFFKPLRLPLIDPYTSRLSLATLKITGLMLTLSCDVRCFSALG